MAKCFPKSKGNIAEQKGRKGENSKCLAQCSNEEERIQDPEMVRKSQQHLTADDVGM